MFNLYPALPPWHNESYMMHRFANMVQTGLYERRRLGKHRIKHEVVTMPDGYTRVVSLDSKRLNTQKSLRPPAWLRLPPSWMGTTQQLRTPTVNFMPGNTGPPGSMPPAIGFGGQVVPPIGSLPTGFQPPTMQWNVSTIPPPRAHSSTSVQHTPKKRYIPKPSDKVPFI